ncbi:hypothetical protein Glove_286g2 [Diversispora epigaea]|uniref:Uncharacterized protein n=1 Tax=Diversispora epigaea TaxID=1348612 RepID=A0A397I0V1_9GLOM|nr:hypothetical protein Glove_286g2 [Diversispora epigaea]
MIFYNGKVFLLALQFALTLTTAFPLTNTTPFYSTNSTNSGSPTASSSNFPNESDQNQNSISQVVIGIIVAIKGGGSGGNQVGTDTEIGAVRKTETIEVAYYEESD